ncbi:unnamed protein product [Parnassius apollo]|uniref:(apollo) hypothetical protein n=1 Tax=Parnassius apollo TaxID=110799 RepID=A0A8S3WVX3_PARAO|nr:unnamed protein product [Parnassius apollo]
MHAYNLRKRGCEAPESQSAKRFSSEGNTPSASGSGIEHSPNIACQPSSSNSTQGPPELGKLRLRRFQTWSNGEKIQAVHALINRCSGDIESRLQQDFISQLPNELALTVLGYLKPKDLMRMAQICRHWRTLADDNLLWKEQCRRTEITTLNEMPPPLSLASPWKSTYMRQYIIEKNWLHKPVNNPIIMRCQNDHDITCLQFYENRILTGSYDMTLKLWCANTGTCLRTLVGHSGGVRSCQMGGDLVISGSTDCTLRVWNAMTGECLQVLTGHTRTVRCMHLYQNRVVSGSRDATLRVWSIPDGRCLQVLAGHSNTVRCVQYDGKLVVSGANDFLVKVWNPETGVCLYTMSGHTDRVYDLKFDGIHVVSASLDTSICVWDVESGQLKHTLTRNRTLTCVLQLQSNILVSGNVDTTVKIWDITTGHCLHTLSGFNKHESAVTSLQSSNRFVTTSSVDGTVKLWDIHTGEFIRNLVESNSGISVRVRRRIRASATKLICAVSSRFGNEETKLLVLDFDVPNDYSGNY